MDYSRKVASANRMIAKYGSARTLVKVVQSGDPARPTIDRPQFACIGVDFDVTNEDIDGKTVLAGDRLAYVAPSLTTEAFTGDTYLDKDGVPYKITKVEKLAPDGTVLLWTFWLRK